MIKHAAVRIVLVLFSKNLADDVMLAESPAGV
jgi:hypothetical protein